MKSIVLFGFLSLLCSFPLQEGEQQKKIAYQRLTLAEMEKLRGSWELKVDSKTGWKGAVYLYVILGAAGGEREGFGALVYDVDLAKGKEILRIRNVLLRTIAGVKQGHMMAMVTTTGRQRAPFEVKPSPELIAPFTVGGNKLTLDFSRSFQHFLPAEVTMLQLDWTKLEWTRSNRKRVDK